jgi:hypothetical protein
MSTPSKSNNKALQRIAAIYLIYYLIYIAQEMHTRAPLVQIMVQNNLALSRRAILSRYADCIRNIEYKIDEPKFGERGRIRTCDPRLKRALLYHLSYAPSPISI